MEVLPGEVLKAVVPVLQRLVVEGGVGVRRSGAGADRFPEQVVVLVDIIIQDLTPPAEALHGVLGGVGL